jgi:hypothetical protein
MRAGGMRAKLIAGLGVATVVAAVTFIYVQSVTGADPRFHACGGDSGHVRAAFAMSHARDFGAHYPHALRTPELETDSPAYVVDFEGTVIPLTTGNPRAPRVTSYKNVLCVFADGVPNWYFDVDKAGMHP